ncbi:MAG: hypothetical protein KDA68_12440 [Planctomycetaceae bacterium]|nr:hypothetical protein [Planctomycetaceae bacterium]
MKNRRVFLGTVLSLAGVCLLSDVRIADAKGGGTVAEISLSPVGGARAKGKAKYKVAGSERELQIEAELGASQRGVSVQFLVNSNVVATLTTDAFGKVGFSANTKEGANVPNISPGTVVQVKRTGGAVLLQGTF